MQISRISAYRKTDDYSDFSLIGSTLDDAVGEAFDKVARTIGLSYPGGPNIEKCAQNGQNNIPLPKMFKGEKNYNFSYSGLKTAVINYVHGKKQKGEEYSQVDVAHSFQIAAIDVLVEKSIRACLENKIYVLTAGGGVVANTYLRESLTKACSKNNIKLVLPPKSLCTDNACMIGAEGYIQYKNRNFATLKLNAKASLPL